MKNTPKGHLSRYFITLAVLIGLHLLAMPIAQAQSTSLDYNNSLKSTSSAQYIERTAIMPVDKAPQLDEDKLFDLVNDYRAQYNLPAFEKDSYLCSLAATRGPEVFNEITYTGALHSGLYSRKLPYWVTENMVTSMTEEKGLIWWLNSPIHHKAIISHSEYSCTRCFGHTCIQLFTDYTPKSYDID